MRRTAARCHLSPNEARTSGISAVNDPLTAEQIQLSPGFLNRHQARYGRGGREGRDGGGHQARDSAGKGETYGRGGVAEG